MLHRQPSSPPGAADRPNARHPESAAPGVRGAKGWEHRPPDAVPAAVKALPCAMRMSRQCLSKVIDAAIANRVIIEINANPFRLDMDWRLWRRAAERGLLCSINPDAHSVEGLSYYRAGVNTARKGWLEKDQILNCRDFEGVVRWLSERK